MMMQVFNIVTMWFSRAMVDGKITAVEMADIVTQIAGIFGLETVIELPGAEFAVQPSADVVNALGDAVPHNNELLRNG